MAVWKKLSRAIKAAREAWANEVPMPPALPLPGSITRPPAIFRRPPRRDPNEPWTLPAKDQYRVYTLLELLEIPPSPTSALGVLAIKSQTRLRETPGNVFAATLPLYRQLHWYWLHANTDGTFLGGRGERFRWEAENFTYSAFWFKGEPIVVIFHRGGERANKDGSHRHWVVTRLALPSELFHLQQTYTITEALTSELKSYMAGAA